MAKQSYGILDGYRGTVGPVIGYQWRGRWCLRARPQRVHNPRTEAQQEHRMLFRDMVQLAGRMRNALRHGMRAAALGERMTEENLFVRMNRECFSPQGVDYGRLQVSTGPVAPVEFTGAEVDGDNVLHCIFEKNPLHLAANGDDQVYVYAYCPQLGRGVLSAPVYRRSKRLSMSLPDEFADREVHFYGFVEDYAQRASETCYISSSDDSDYLGNLDYSNLLQEPIIDSKNEKNLEVNGKMCYFVKSDRSD